MNQLMAQASGGSLDETAALIYAIEATEAVNALAAVPAVKSSIQRGIVTYLDALQSRSADSAC